MEVKKRVNKKQQPEKMKELGRQEVEEGDILIKAVGLGTLVLR